MTDEGRAVASRCFGGHPGGPGALLILEIPVDQRRRFWHFGIRAEIDASFPARRGRSISAELSTPPAL